MRRAQSSVEFLMTYGWVFIIIIVAMVMMWQWGLFSYGGKIEPGSFGLWGVTILGGNDFIVDTDGVAKISV
ncbi:MAG: hypothetical protein KKD39_01295, partial [Candidatus Altiarchaeota archaeon]|nr:hypothetical protein [Candidatus Altiarchaeota archaeon]